MAPFDVIASLGKFLGYLVFLLVGLGFGAALEMSGFGDSRKLAAQFYLKDMTVLKVMFTAIIVAMTLIFGASAIGILDFNRIFVTETYLLPGIIGGLIMGVGFIVGGFCPGTSIVALATFKIDGFFFAGGVAFGVFLFGESVSIFQGFHNSTFMGRYILPEWLGLPTGVVVLLVVFMALMMFYGAELSERFFGAKIPWKEIKKGPENRTKMVASALLVFVAMVVMFAGQPTAMEKWQQIEAQEMPKLTNRDVYIHPGEVLEIMNDHMLYSTLLDVRNETDFNLFHLENARRVTFDKVHDMTFIKDLVNAPNNTVVVLMSNDEADATEMYKLLRGLGVLNIYILEGGINRWLEVFPLHHQVAEAKPAIKSKTAKSESLNYTFTKAIGASTHEANPGTSTDLAKRGITFTKKVKIQKKKVMSGGCG